MAEDTNSDENVTLTQATNETSNGAGHEDTAESPTTTPGNTIRSRGSKVSNLRAAFEQSSSNGPTTRPASSEKRILSQGQSSVDVELARLKEVLAKEQEQKDAEKQRMDTLQVELEELREQLRIEQDSRDVTMSDTNGYDNHEEMAIELHNARAQAQAYEDELIALRNQLGDMKRSIATNTRIESHEMTDSAFQGEFGTLCYSLQDWVINTYRKAKVERTSEEMCAVIDGLDEQQRNLLRPIYERWDSGYKLVFLQAAIVSLLLPIFQDPMPFGLPENLVWSVAVRTASEELSRVLDSAAYNRWRATTFDIICHSEVISPFVHSAANKITDTICSTIDTICGTTTAETQADSLRNMVRRMIALSHSLRVQRASYEVELPAPGTSIELDSMEEINEDYEEDSERVVQCAVFPAVFKTGTAGRAVIFKARVS